MALRSEELAKTIDHTLLDPQAAREEIERQCRQSRELHVASVCVLPEQVAAAAEELRGSDVKVCAVVGFPNGAARPATKIRSAEEALAEGAGELEFVMNVEALRRGDVRLVRDELVSFARTIRMKTANGGRGALVLKAVIGTPQLDDKLAQLACRIVEFAEIDFAQTAIGQSEDGPTLHEVELLRDALSERVGVKASGRIETLDEVQALVSAGAGRVGSVFAVDLLSAPPALARA
jgi:deoxyribose-phosphate aldolase